MSVIDQLLSVLAPYDCLGCEAEGNLLCEDCIQQLTVTSERCYRCLRLSSGGITCGDCGQSSSLYRVHAGADYSGLAKDLVWRLKSSGAQAAAQQMAGMLSPLLESETGLTIVPVPTAANRIRGRGYDQSKLLARELARQTRLPYMDCLIRSGYTHQVGASRQQRLSQLDGAFRISRQEKVRKKHILLVDDVVTTGATLETAAELLAANGAAHVSAIVFARA